MEMLHIQPKEISGDVKSLSDYLDFKPVAYSYCLEGADLDVAAQCDVLKYFHATEVFMHKERDDYFAFIRADHFVIEVGFSEMGGPDDGKWITVVCTGNHKGLRAITVVQFKHPDSEDLHA